MSGEGPIRGGEFSHAPTGEGVLAGLRGVIWSSASMRKMRVIRFGRYSEPRTKTK